MKPNFPQRCVCVVSDSRIICEENGKSITFLNSDQQECRKIQVDGCVITEGRRCDWLLIDQSKNEYFVELKGSHIGDAIEQLKASIERLHDSSQRKVELRAYIVAKKFPPSYNTKIQLFDKYLKKYNGILIRRENKFEETLPKYHP